MDADNPIVLIGNPSWRAEVIEVIVVRRRIGTVWLS
jgi:hypothetical protein